MEDLMDFNWDDTIETPTTVESEETTVETEESDTSDENDVEVEEESKKTKSVDPLDDFGSDEESSEDEEEDVEEEPNKETTSIYTDLFKDLKERGLIKNVDLEDEEDLDADKFFELKEQEIEAEVTNRLNSWANKDLDEDGQAFIKFKLSGGKTEDFFKVYSQSVDLSDGDIEDEDFQDKLIRKQLEDDGWDSEEIEDRLEVLTENGKKAKIAQKYYNRILHEQEEEKKALEESAKQQQQQALETQRKFNQELKETVNGLEEVKGFKLSQKDKGEIFDMMTKKNYKTPNGVMITGLQAKISEAFQDKEKAILLAKILKDDFDFSSFENKVKNKTVRKIKSNLESRKSYKPTGSGSSLEGRSLADLFN